MTQSTARGQVAIGCLVGLIVLNVVMLGALFGGVQPGPPPAFGPYIGTSAALAAVAAVLLVCGNRTGYPAALGAGLMTLLSVGPHKFALEQDWLVLSPLIVLGTILCAAVIGIAVAAWRKGGAK